MTSMQDLTHFSLENKTRLTGFRIVLPDTATGPAIEHGCGMFFEHPQGACFLELTAQECQELILWLQGNHDHVRKPDNATLN